MRFLLGVFEWESGLRVKEEARGSEGRSILEARAQIPDNRTPLRFTRLSARKSFSFLFLARFPPEA